MSLNKSALKTALIGVFTSQYNGTLTTEQQQGVSDLADGLSNAIDTFVKTGTVTTSAGIAVQVTPSTGTGATTANGIGSIS